MSAIYPGALKTFTAKTNKADLVDAAHVNDIQDEVTAIETELGTDVAGSKTDLKTRLAVLMADDGAVAKGTSFPGSPVDGQAYYRTDSKTLFIYNSGTASWVSVITFDGYSAGSYTELNASTERNVTVDTNWFKIKGTTPMNRSGSLTIEWEHRNANNATPIETKVYVNDIAVGAAQGPNSTNVYATVSDTPISVVPGDTIQIYGRKQSGANTDVYVRNLKIKSANPTVPQEESGY